MSNAKFNFPLDPQTMENEVLHPQYMGYNP